MKSIPQMLSSRWMKLLAVLLVAAWCSSVNAAYWNRTRTHTHSQGRDLDGDGIPNVVDPDIDNDGIPNILDKNIDGGIAKTGPYAGKYIGDHSDNDSPSEDDIDDDGLADDSLGEKDIDGDGKPDDDPTEDDIDGDGRKNDDPADMDIDGDGLKNSDASEFDEDGDEIDDIDDDDDDHDGIKDIDDDSHHPEDQEGEIELELDRQSAAPEDSSAKIKLQKYGTGEIKFSVEASDLVAGNYQLMVGEVARGTIAVVQESSKTQGRLVFKSAGSGSGDLLLDFTVAGQAIALVNAGTVYFSGIAPELPAIGPEAGEDSVALTRSPGVPPEAAAEAVLHFGTSGPTELEVSLEKVPAGDYLVVIGDSTRGTLVVSGPAGESQGQLNFKVEDSEDALPLNFPSAGQSIAIIQGSTTFFFGQLPAAAP
jgi:hypothetical protein